MFQGFFRFFLLFTGILVLTYFIHSWIIDFFSITSNVRIFKLSYIFNGVAAFILILGILFARNRFKDQLGLIFLAGSFIKLGIFVIITKWQAVEMTKSVFLDFFIAYAICMVFEVYYVSKILKSIN